MLLELLSDFQISIPSSAASRPHPPGRPAHVEQHPVRLTEALKRRCLYLWLDYP